MTRTPGVGTLIEIAGKQYVVNRLTETKGRLQIDAIEVEEAKRRVRDLQALLTKAGITPMED